jgi:hypothetical protein
MWTVVYLAQNKSDVDRMQKVLEENEIIVRVRCVADKEAQDAPCYEVLVPQTEISQAQNVIIDQELF